MKRLRVNASGMWSVSRPIIVATPRTTIGTDWPIQPPAQGFAEFMEKLICFRPRCRREQAEYASLVISGIFPQITRPAYNHHRDGDRNIDHGSPDLCQLAGYGSEIEAPEMEVTPRPIQIVQGMFARFRKLWVMPGSGRLFHRDSRNQQPQRDRHDGDAADEDHHIGKASADLCAPAYPSRRRIRDHGSENSRKREQ